MADKIKKKISIPQDSDVNEAVETSPSAFKQTFVDTLQESIFARNEMKAVLHEICKKVINSLLLCK
jgi:hypothetical protein